MNIRFTLPLALLAGVLAVAVPTQVQAQSSPEYNSCMARAQKATVQQSLCLQAETGRQDARLNKAYQQVMSQYPADDAKRITLRDEERTWIKRRDYECKLDRETVDSGCLAEKTAQRADELERRVKF